MHICCNNMQQKRYLHLVHEKPNCLGKSLLVMWSFSFISRCFGCILPIICTHCTALSCNVLICAVLVCSRLQEMEQTCEMDMEAMRQECSRRVSDVERRLQVAVREKDALKVSLHDAEMEVSRRLVVWWWWWCLSGNFRESVVMVCCVVLQYSVPLWGHTFTKGALNIVCVQKTWLYKTLRDLAVLIIIP